MKVGVLGDGMQLSPGLNSNNGKKTTSHSKDLVKVNKYKKDALENNSYKDSLAER